MHRQRFNRLFQGTLQPETILWLSNLPSRPNQLVINAVDVFIKTCKADGNWELLDRFWLFAQDNQVNSLRSIVNPSSTPCSEVNSPGWVQYQGYLSNGSSSYINSNFNASIHGVKYTLNNFSFGFYSLTNIQETNIDMGALDGSNRAYIYSRRATNITVSTANTALDNSGVPITNTNSSGFIVVNRIISTSFTTLRNGSSLGTSTITTTGLPNTSFFICSLSSGGTPSSFSNKRIAFAYTGSGNINHVKFNTAITVLRTTLGF